MRREPDFFGERQDDLVLVYIAKRLKDALALETVLNEAGIEYLIEVDQYHGGIIFRGQRTGAFFYVLPEAGQATRETMRGHGYKPHEGE